MKAYLRLHGRCFLFGFVAGWAIAIFLSSALIGVFGMSPVSGDCGLSCTLPIADAVSPSIKVLFGLLFAFALLVPRTRNEARTGIAQDILAAVFSMVAVVVLVPEPLSRGFGIGLTGDRFDPALAAIYLAAAIVAGLAAHLLERNCKAMRGES